MITSLFPLQTRVACLGNVTGDISMPAERTTLTLKAFSAGEHKSRQDDGPGDQRKEGGGAGAVAE